MIYLSNVVDQLCDDLKPGDTQSWLLIRNALLAWIREHFLAQRITIRGRLAETPDDQFCAVGSAKKIKPYPDLKLGYGGKNDAQLRLWRIAEGETLPRAEWRELAITMKDSGWLRGHLREQGIDPLAAKISASVEDNVRQALAPYRGNSPHADIPLHLVMSLGLICEWAEYPEKLMARIERGFFDGTIRIFGTTRTGKHEQIHHSRLFKIHWPGCESTFGHFDPYAYSRQEDDVGRDLRVVHPEAPEYKSLTMPTEAWWRVWGDVVPPDLLEGEVVFSPKATSEMAQSVPQADVPSAPSVPREAVEESEGVHLQPEPPRPLLDVTAKAAGFLPPRTRGPKATVGPRIRKAMFDDISAGFDLSGMKQEEMKVRYKVSASMCRDARNKVLAELLLPPNNAN